MPALRTSGRRIAALAAASVAVLLLSACGADPVHGTITEKEYKRSTTTYTNEPVTRSECSSTRKNGKTKKSCHQVKTGATKRVAHHKDECYQIELDNDAHELCISKSKWNKVRVGDKW
ncbi:hypothetical protein OG599_11565 [Streptomyces sp. NBC_01335]|uniref:hypothetical protein n=1 Tax=Streptomyces sp. NBC_01335 TaxID=2903828 RepID=UPI002E15C1A4|nr:hypothetical protein OG599_11565 [Streptomyces sp. NBC_01335]